MAKTHDVNELDWATDGVWVQARMMYRLAEGQSACAQVLRLFDQLGWPRVMPRQRLLQTHIPMLGFQVFKPRPLPIRAFSAPAAIRVKTNADCFDLAPGDALVQETSGRVRHVPYHRFHLCYRLLSPQLAPL